MSSNIHIKRICQHCGNEFTARTTVTRYCGDDCAKRAYKVRQRQAKIQGSELETIAIKEKPQRELQAKDFLTVREAAQLLSCSIRTLYQRIERGDVKAVNLGARLTRIKRTELDRLFEASK